MRTILFLLLATFVLPALTVYAFAEIEKMEQFLPDKTNLPSYWKMGPVNTIEELEIGSSNEEPDGVLRQFALNNQTGDSSIVVTLSVYEFSNDASSDKAHRNYTANLKEDYEILEIKDFTNSECFGVIKDKNKSTEASSITCSKDVFLVISTAEQQGKVYEKGIKLQTSQVSAGFAEFVIDQIDKQPDFPPWIKQNVLWLIEEKIDESTFLYSIQYMVSKGHLEVHGTPTLDPSKEYISQNNKDRLEKWTYENPSQETLVEIITDILQIQE